MKIEPMGDEQLEANEHIRRALARVRSPMPSTPEYEAMVDAGERAALDTEMDSGWRYAEEDAFARLRRKLDTGEDQRGVTLRAGDARDLLRGYDRLVQSERAYVEFRNADLKRRMAESHAIRNTQVCPTCTKPVHPPAVQALIDAAQHCLNEEQRFTATFHRLLNDAGTPVAAFTLSPRYQRLADALAGVNKP